MPFNEQSIMEFVVLGKSVSGQNVFNVFHYRQSDTTPTAYDNADLGDAATEFSGHWQNFSLPILSDDYSFQTIRARAYTGTIANPTPPPPNVLVTGEQFDLVLPAPVTGILAGEPLPTFAAVGIQKLSSRAGRNFRGGYRWGIIREADVVNNSLQTPVYLAAVTAAASGFTAATLSINFGASIWEMCIFSRTLALAAPPPFGLLRDLTAKVTGAKVNPFVSSQVSRKQSPTQPT